MDSKKTLYGSIAFISFFALAACLFFLLYIQPHFFFFAQQPPFQKTVYFLKPYLAFPGGISYYLANFLMQFFTVNWLGSLIITLTLTALLLLSLGIFSGLKRPGGEWIIIFLPVTLLFGLFTNYYFPFTAALNTLLVYAGLYLSTLLFRTGNPRWYFYFLVAPVLYYIGGGSCLILYSAGFLTLLFFRLPGVKKAFLAALPVIAFCLALPFLSFKFLFHIPQSKAFFEYYPTDSLLAVNYTRNITFYLFFFSAPALVLVNELLSRFRGKKVSMIKEKPKKGKTAKEVKIEGPSRFQQVSVYLVYALITALSVLFAKTNLPVLGNKIVRANYHCAHGNWKEVLSVVKSHPEYDVNLNFFYNRAIGNTGRYLEDFFEYPQLVGSATTDPEKGNFGLLYMYWSDYYYDLGHIAESEKWTYRALVGFPYCPRILERLVKINMILGRYAAAGKFLTTLEDNLVSKKFVNQYSAMIEDTSLVHSNEEIMDKRACMPVDLITPERVTFRYRDLLDKNPENQKAYEHMQMDLLLAHDFWHFYKNLPLGAAYYNELPELFQQALIILKTKNVQIDGAYHISPEMIQEFRQFWSLYEANHANQKRVTRLLQPYKNTLYYYILFDSPRVTKMALETDAGEAYYH